MTSNPYISRCRGAAMLLGVVMLVISATLAATGLIISNSSRNLSQSTELRVMISRNKARSLVSIIQNEIENQHESVIAGEMPEFNGATEFTTLSAGSRWIARVVQSAGQPVLVSEAGKLNLNSVPESVLKELESMSAETASAIVRGRPFTSVRGAVAAADESMDAEWVDWVTVFSVEPAVSIGLRIPAGDPRIFEPDQESPPAEWQRFVEDSGFDPFAAEFPPTDTATLYNLCVSSQVTADFAGQALDLLTFNTQPSVGLLDINTASAECIAALPGIDHNLAHSLIDTRERLSAEELRPLTWPVREGVLSAAELAGVISLITTRTLQWGFTIEAGLAMNDSDDPGVVPLEYPARYAVILDTTTAATRVIMIRDETNSNAAVPPPLIPREAEPEMNRLSSLPTRTPRRSVQSNPEPAPKPSSAGPVRRDRRGGGP